MAKVYFLKDIYEYKEEKVEAINTKMLTLAMVVAAGLYGVIDYIIIATTGFNIF